MGEADLSPAASTALSAAIVWAAVYIAGGALLLFALRRALAGGARRDDGKNTHRVGADWGGESAEVVEWSGREGLVRAGGELWKAVSADPLAPGDAVSIAGADGLTLDVRKK